MNVAVGRLELVLRLAPEPPSKPAVEARDDLSQTHAQEEQWKAVDADRERWLSHYLYLVRR